MVSVTDKVVYAPKNRTSILDTGEIINRVVKDRISAFKRKAKSISTGSDGTVHVHVTGRVKATGNFNLDLNIKDCENEDLAKKIRAAFGD